MYAVSGSLCAVSSAVLVGTGIVTQATAVRRLSARHAYRPSILVQLARSLTWLAAVVLGLAGWGLHVLALRLAPLTIVQPALASTLVVVLVLSATVLHERIGKRDLAGIAFLTAGIGLLLASAPPSGHNPPAGLPLAVATALLGLVSVAPFALRRDLQGRAAVALAAGAAFALCNIATKLFTQALSASDHPAVAGWLCLVGLSAALGTVTQTSALQSLQATRVVGIAFATETIVPVMLAPELFGEHWTSAGTAAVLLRLAALAAVTGGIVLLAASRAVAGAVGGRW